MYKNSVFFGWLFASQKTGFSGFRYRCIPIAESLLVKGALLGVVLSFMMAVTTLSLPSMIMLSKAIKPKLLGVFVSICTLGIIIVGYVFNLVQGFLI